MGGIGRRLDRLERGGRKDEEGAIASEAMVRVTTEDLLLFEALVERLPEEVQFIDENDDLTGEEQAALDRYAKLHEEVRREPRSYSSTPSRRSRTFSRTDSLRPLSCSS